MPRALVALIWAVITLVVTLLIANLSIGNKPIDAPLRRLYGVESPDFEHLIGALLTPPLTAGNKVQALVNGEEIFPAMLDAVRSAQQSITLETYIYWSGSVAREFTDALVERARHGVRIKLLLDWFGSELDDGPLDEMRKSGIEIRRYNPPSWYNLARINHRTHRRLMVVDGTTGFIGGAGIADKWSGDAQDSQHWRDTHFRVEGPAVTQMQSAFIDNWIETTGEALHSVDFLPQLNSQGAAMAHVFSSAPRNGAKTMQLLYLMSITSATKTIDLSAAYFVPDEVALQTLVQALRRNVRVRIIVPGPHMDQSLVAHASRSKWGDLLEAGAEIYEYQPTMFHCKVMVVDSLWTSVGSTNFDSRSFSINSEANLNVYDADFAKRQTVIFERDLQHSRRVTLQHWQGRSLWSRSIDAAAGLLGSQL